VDSPPGEDSSSPGRIATKGYCLNVSCSQKLYRHLVNTTLKKKHDLTWKLNYERLSTGQILQANEKGSGSNKEMLEIPQDVTVMVGFTWQSPSSSGSGVGCPFPSYPSSSHNHPSIK